MDFADGGGWGADHGGFAARVKNQGSRVRSQGSRMKIQDFLEWQGSAAAGEAAAQLISAGGCRGLRSIARAYKSNTEAQLKKSAGIRPDP